MLTDEVQYDIVLALHESPALRADLTSRVLIQTKDLIEDGSSRTGFARQKAPKPLPVAPSLAALAPPLLHREVGYLAHVDEQSSRNSVLARAYGFVHLPSMIPFPDAYTVAQSMLPDRLNDMAADLAADEYGSRWPMNDYEIATAVNRLQATAIHLANAPRRGSAPSAVLFALKPALAVSYESAVAALARHLLSVDWSAHMTPRGVPASAVQAEVAHARWPGGMSRQYLPDALTLAGLPIKKSSSNYVPLHDDAAREKAQAFVTEHGGQR